LSPDKVYYILFTTIHEVLKAEQLLKGHEKDIEVVPVPRSLSSDCGVCIRSKAAPEVFAGLLGGMAGSRCFLFDGTGYEQVTITTGG